jgi:hypothetical protein
MIYESTDDEHFLGTISARKNSSHEGQEYVRTNRQIATRSE